MASVCFSVYLSKHQMKMFISGTLRTSNVDTMYIPNDLIDIIQKMSGIHHVYVMKTSRRMFDGGFFCLNMDSLSA